MMTQFTEYDKNSQEYHNSETAQHKDQIVAICILIIVQITTNKKTKFGKDKNDLDEVEKLKLIQKIRENVEKNAFLLNNSYLTLMMLAFRRDSLSRKEGDVIPQLTEVLDVIKQQKNSLKNERN
jgi:hypothetical protein